MGEALVIAAFLGLIPATIANRKGRSFALWWFYGWMLFIVALIHSLLIRPRPAGVNYGRRGFFGRTMPPPYFNQGTQGSPLSRQDPYQGGGSYYVNPQQVPIPLENDQGPYATPMIPCPNCGEAIRRDTPSCPFCRYDFTKDKS
ncbi:MAG: zinc ribbon domain-containing protein [Actinobacteria bacterium]|jgi:hypothetical protein|nr:zinc ribbon domain-containing protein [Actinomycetota bacterium]